MFENILNELVKRIEEKEGLSIFARQRSKFEGWLKVELVDILKSKNKEFQKIADYCIGDVIAEAELFKIWKEYLNF